MPEKEKKPRSAKQLANDERLRQKAAERRALAGNKIETDDVSSLIRPDIQPEIPAPEAPASPFAQLPEDEKDKLIIELQAKYIAALEANQGNAINKSAAVDELATIPFAGGVPNGVVVSAQGGIQGQVFKYPVDKNYYADPTDRLYDVPELKRFGLRDNYLITWDVQGETYEKNNITYNEPRFIVHLYRRIYDEEGLDTGQAALVSRSFSHEDDYIATIIANREGLTGLFNSKEELMEEIRFRRIRDWLIGLFTPAKFQKFAKKPRTMVIDGKAVEVFDTEQIIGEDAASAKASAVQSQVKL